MMSSDSPQKPRLWIALVIDAVLLTTAYLIRHEAPKPLPINHALGIIGCVALGALITFVWIVWEFERAKNEALDDRQRALEALARTLNEAAEQISIATSGLNEITELAQKNLKQAEQLPHKLQEKIALFQAQLDDANATEKEELEKELAELRASESERLEATATKIAKAVGEFAKLETATAQHLAAANDAVGKLSFSAAGAIGKAQAAAEQAFTQARSEAMRGLGEAAGTAAKTIETAMAAALAEFDKKLAEAKSAAAALATAPAVAPAAPAAPVAAPETTSAAPAPEETAAQPPKKPRKRREEPVTEEAPPAAEAAAPKDPVAEEPAPIPVEKIPEITPVAPHTSEPFPGNIASKAEPAAEPAPPANDTATAESPPASAAAAAPAEPKAPRKRAPKKPDAESAPEPSLDLALDDSPAKAAAELVERVLSSDGATRLLVTAYIGIGNRLFIRGTGPGLSWDKGTPLQFVSIGKWRWETNDAAGPIQFKLYKNDDLECAALGAQQLDPGYQQEVTAAF